MRQFTSQFRDDAAAHEAAPVQLPIQMKASGLAGRDRFDALCARFTYNSLNNLCAKSDRYAKKLRDYYASTLCAELRKIL